jgi:CDP-glucose 4,6-dehydratase
VRLPDPGFWAGRRVLVTGHTGFKGSWLALWLTRLGARVTGLALSPATQPALFDLLGLERELDSRIGDVRDERALAAAFAASRPEIVLHLAAQPLVRAGYREPVETFEVNVMGTARVLEAARRARGVRAIVVVTTDKCYVPRADAAAHREEDRLGGPDPYGASKACAELVAEAYRTSYLRAAGIATASVRAGNVIGGGDWSPERLITDVVAALRGGTPLTLRYPHAVRPWQHVLDPLAAYLILAERLAENGDVFARGWNVGPDEASSVSAGELVDRFCRAWGSAPPRTRDASAQPHENPVLLLDSSAARAALPWSPRLEIGEAVAWTAAWYREHAHGADAAELTERQIVAYGEAATGAAAVTGAA